ncbi:hypothetical protein L2E82_25084 [Cichorium intybus]|uniref:Uncharacterized protein n=1 Tax=Cichorium intybus TaxID=13427 RepID=A0ACB9E2X6_CICIN|nr:hypothetical protein L2E82_25084 [Cichorium intybus]
MLIYLDPDSSRAIVEWDSITFSTSIFFLYEQDEYSLFKPYKHKYHVPFKASQSRSPLWYSIKRASAHIIVLSSYSAFVVLEPWFVKYKVDLVFSGHVHSYELSERVSIRYNITDGLSTPVKDPFDPVYITIGDGGNIEGIAERKQPDYSAFREASFGHALLEIKNRTHALYNWHCNKDNVAVSGVYCLPD